MVRQRIHHGAIGVRVVYVPQKAGSQFHVYADHGESDQLRGIVAFLRIHGLPFTIGGAVDDRSRVLTIGPLVDGDAVGFVQAWGAFIVF
jgi:hypothetical protein